MFNMIGTHFDILVVAVFCVFAAGLASVSVYDALRR
jgi:hypothetical protein